MKSILIAAFLTLFAVSVVSAESYYLIQAKHSNGYLNVLNAGKNNGDKVCQGLYKAEELKTFPNFYWEIIPAKGGYFYIKAKHSGQYLNVLNAGKGNGDAVVQGVNNSTENFLWQIIPAGGDFAYIKAKHSGQYLNIINAGKNNADLACQGATNTTDNFLWLIAPAQ